MATVQNFSNEYHRMWEAEVTTLQPGRPENQDLVPSRTKDLSRRHSILTASGASKLVSSEWRPETRPHWAAAETLRCSLTFIQLLGDESVQYTSIPQYTFMALRLIKQRNIFNFLHPDLTSFVSVTTNHRPASHSRLLYAVCIMQLNATSH